MAQVCLYTPLDSRYKSNKIAIILLHFCKFMRYLNLLFLTEAAVLLGVFFGLTDEILISDWAMVLKNLFPTDRLVISTQYYGLSKITSSINLIFIIINSIIAIIWVMYQIINSERFRQILLEQNAVAFLFCIFWFSLITYNIYFDALQLVPYKTSRLMPIDNFLNLIWVTFVANILATSSMLAIALGLGVLILKFKNVLKSN